MMTLVIDVWPNTYMEYYASFAHRLTDLAVFAFAGFVSESLGSPLSRWVCLSPLGSPQSAGSAARSAVGFPGPAAADRPD